jgi:type IV pilus assembly protein PilA
VIDKIKNRLASEQGFTLIELLVVIVILGILVAIAVPSYLSFRGNAAQAAAEANVRSAIPAAEGFYQDPNAGNGSYSPGGTDMTAADLTAQAPGVDPNIGVTVSSAGGAYCLDITNGTKMAYYIGGDSGEFTLAAGAAPATVTTGAVCSSVVS